MSRIREAIAKAQRARERTGPAEAETRPFGRIAARQAKMRGAAAENKRAREPAAEAEAAPGRHVEVDRDALHRAGLLLPQDQGRQLADEYRQIKRPILSNAAGHRGVHVPRGNLVMISGAMPNEGKTFTCINLSLSIALEKDWHVLLVDGDIAKRHLTTLFGLEEEPGLLDLLRDPSLSVADCTIGSDIAGVSIMPAGQKDEHATELLASNRMAEVAEVLSERDPGQMTLFDSPPLLATTEAPALASHMGQIVVVVKAGHTVHQQVLQAVSMLDSDKAVSLMLNQTEARDDSLGYGASYGYYGYGRQVPGDVPEGSHEPQHELRE